MPIEGVISEYACMRKLARLKLVSSQAAKGIYSSNQVYGSSPIFVGSGSVSQVLAQSVTNCD